MLSSSLWLLYAVSLTLLLVRLKYRFGTTHTAVSLGKELAAPLTTYTGKTRDAFTGISPYDAHRAALALSQFSTGEYAQAARSAGMVTEQTGELPGVLTRAFAIVHEHATVLELSLPRPEPFLAFLPEDEDLLANPLLPEYSEDRKFDTTFDNAMLLLFSAAWNYAEADRPHLLACQGFALKLLVD
jgi:hypothetical protein